MKYTIFTTGMLAAGTLALVGCQSMKETPMDTQPGTFGYDAAFLQEHTDAIVLKKGQSAILVVPEYQGRVMTATAQGNQGASSGWINYDLVQQGVLPPAEAAGKLRYAADARRHAESGSD